MSHKVQKSLKKIALSPQTILYPALSATQAAGAGGQEALTQAGVLPEIPEPVKPKKQAKMPIADAAQAMMIRRRSTASQAGRGGRASTILTSPESLG